VSVRNEADTHRLHSARLRVPRFGYPHGFSTDAIRESFRKAHFLSGNTKAFIEMRGFHARASRQERVGSCCALPNASTTIRTCASTEQ
jgi:hypothetical protein